MKQTLVILFLFGGISCSDQKEKSTPFSTVDSNTLSKDSIPAILYLDNTKQDTFPMAMDSAGPTINADDTSYQKPGN